MSRIPRFLRGRAHRLALLSLAALVCARPCAAAPEAAPTAPPSLVLITLDTTRADYVGRIDGNTPLTPNLDALARRGTRFIRALTVAPLTLPAHCTLMTGMNPPVHGVHDNGMSALPSDIPTLATVLRAHGYETAAFVSSRVLDRRFGLDRGFGLYDDEMVAERTGEQGYPERSASAVTGAVLDWARGLPAGRPYFVWVHYYDAHSPYQPPGDWAGQSAARRYGGEIAYVDHEIGRLLRGLPDPPAGRVIAAVGDHGEMLGEHGERDHGVFLYRASLDVPLILAGPGVPAGATVGETVATRALAATLLAILPYAAEARGFGSALPGVGGAARTSEPIAVYSETLLPADTYGWSPLRAASDARLRLIVAPRPELYDFVADPSESHNLFAERPKDVRRLQAVIDEAQSGSRPSAAITPNPELAESLRSLGYLSGASRPREGGIDPKDGIRLLEEFDAAKRLTREGHPREAVEALQSLVRKSPGNVPFLMRLGEAQLAAGMIDESLKTMAYAVTINPGLDFLHVRLGQACAQGGHVDRARKEYELALELNPRSAPAWSGLAEIARRTGAPGSELIVLQKCNAAGTRSATLLARLADLETAAGDPASAKRHREEALLLTRP